MGGYRVSAYVANGKATIKNRNGHDWTARFPAIARAAVALKVRSAVIDGAAVILDDRGRSSFAELQADLDRHVSDRACCTPSICCSDSEDLRKKSLEERRLALGGIIPKRSAILLSEDFAGSVRTSSRSLASLLEFEGIVSKRLEVIVDSFARLSKQLAINSLL